VNCESTSTYAFPNSQVHCPKIVASEGLTVSDPSSHGLNAHVHFSCSNGNDLIGTSPLDCLPSGHWSDPIPACQECLVCFGRNCVRSNVFADVHTCDKFLDNNVLFVLLEGACTGSRFLAMSKSSSTRFLYCVIIDPLLSLGRRVSSHHFAEPSLYPPDPFR
jgi:hypothetical protein